MSMDAPDGEVQVVWVTVDGEQHKTAFTTRQRADDVVVPGILADYRGRIRKIWLQGRHRIAGDELLEPVPPCPVCAHEHTAVWTGPTLVATGPCHCGCLIETTISDSGDLG